jgi:hypothetical protein
MALGMGGILAQPGGSAASSMTSASMARAWRSPSWVSPTNDAAAQIGHAKRRAVDPSFGVSVGQLGKHAIGGRLDPIRCRAIDAVAGLRLRIWADIGGLAGADEHHDRRRSQRVRRIRRSDGAGYEHVE